MMRGIDPISLDIVSDCDQLFGAMAGGKNEGSIDAEPPSDEPQNHHNG